MSVTRTATRIWFGVEPTAEDVARSKADVDAFRRIGADASAPPWEVATARADRLLRSYLSADQVSSVDREGWFEVVSSRGRPWRILVGYSVRNCLLLDEKRKKVSRWCLQQAELVPEEDANLAQKLLLETDEDAFLAVAKEAKLDTPAAVRLDLALAVVEWATEKGLLPA